MDCFRKQLRQIACIGGFAPEESLAANAVNKAFFGKLLEYVLDGSRRDAKSLHEFTDRREHFSVLKLLT